LLLLELFQPLSIFQKSVSVVSVEAFVDDDEKKPEYSGSSEHLVPVFEMIGNHIFFFRPNLKFSYSEEKVIPGIVLAFSAFYITVGYLYYAEIM
jgi:hypothetical protein